jgi:hypothetical protein
MSTQTNSFEPRWVQLRVDIIPVVILGLGVIVTLSWNIAVARFVLHFFDLL